MTRTTFVLGVGVAAFCGASEPGTRPAPEAQYEITSRWVVGGRGGWDYLTVDTIGKRLFVTRSDHVDVLNLADGKSLGQVAPTNGVHGVALAPMLGKGYASNGKADSVSVFDFKTLAITATIAIDGHDPDAIVFDEATSRILIFNGHSKNATVIDASTEKPVATIPLSGTPEFAVSDGKGRVFVNIEDRGELSEIDARAAKVVANWKLAECEDPSGLALDPTQQRLFSVCQNGHLVVTDARSGNHLATVAIGKGPDGVVFDAERHLLFSSNGGDGTLTIIWQKSSDQYDVIANLVTQLGARTLALDPNSHRIFLAAAEFDPLPAEHSARPRPAMKAGSFTVLVSTSADAR